MVLKSSFYFFYLKYNLSHLPWLLACKLRYMSNVLNFKEGQQVNYYEAYLILLKLYPRFWTK